MPTGKRTTSTSPSTPATPANRRSHHTAGGGGGQSQADVVSFEFRFRNMADTNPTMNINGLPLLIGCALSSLNAYADRNRSGMIGGVPNTPAPIAPSAGNQSSHTTPRKTRTPAQRAGDRKRRELAAQRKAQGTAAAAAHGR